MEGRLGYRFAERRLICEWVAKEGRKERSDERSNFMEVDKQPSILLGDLHWRRLTRHLLLQQSRPMGKVEAGEARAVGVEPGYLRVRIGSM